MMPTVKSSKSGFTCARPASLRAAAGAGDGLAAGVLPRVACALAERGGRLAFDDDLHVVHAARTACARDRGAAARRGGGPRCPSGAPSSRRRRNTRRVVDDDELLVMRRADGQMAVEQDLDALAVCAGRRSSAGRTRGAPRRGPGDSTAGCEARAAAGASAASAAACRARRGAPSVGLESALEPRAAVQLPTENEDRALRGEQRSAQRFEVARRRR